MCARVTSSHPKKHLNWGLGFVGFHLSNVLTFCTVFGTQSTQYMLIIFSHFSPLSSSLLYFPSHPPKVDQTSEKRRERPSAPAKPSSQRSELGRLTAELHPAPSHTRRAPGWTATSQFWKRSIPGPITATSLVKHFLTF